MNFFLQMKESVIDTKFYRQIKDNRFGRSFTYLMILYFFIYCMYSTIVFLGMQSGINDFEAQLKNNIPDFRLANGQFEFKGKSPFVISSLPDEILVFDTSGQANESALKDAQIGVLVTKDALYVKQKSDVRRLNLAETKGVVLTKADVAAYIPELKTILLAVLVLGFIAALGWKLLNAVFLALIGKIFSDNLKTDLKFNNILNFSIYALTLPLLLQLAIFLSGISFPFFFIIYWFISIAYVIMAIKGYKDEMDRNRQQEDQNMFLV